MVSLGHAEPADACRDLGIERGYGNRFVHAPGEIGNLRAERLSRTIESEIIPRLMLAHGVFQAGDAVLPKRNEAFPTRTDVETLANRLLGKDLELSAAFVHSLRDRGVPLDAIFLDLFAPAARLLGELWEADRCDFVDVTMGLSRLQQILRDLGPGFERECSPTLGGRRILLVPAPGENHTFGLAIAEEFFRRAGWEVWVEAPRSTEALVEFLRGMWFGVIGFSLSGDRLLDPLAEAIRALRQGSLNRSIAVMVGGKAFVDRPELVERVGADATASDARQAVEKAQTLIGLVGSPC